MLHITLKGDIIMVYVINKHGRSLMPCTPRTARLLLRDKCAKVISRDPFTIKLLIGVPGYTQPLVLGIDPGSKYIGSAVRTETNQAIYLSEIHQRTDVTKKMTQRKMYRVNRRGRKTRYRKPRFSNRKNSTKTNRYPPTLENKFHTIEREVEFVCKKLPITKLYIEMGKFDMHAMTNPDVLKNHWMYQQGNEFGFYNTKAYVLNRDDYTCQCCKGKKKDPRLHCHHIIYRRNGGSDRADNLIVVCETCHDDIHANKITLTKKQLLAVKKSLKHATQMNVLCSMIKKRFVIDTFTETSGYIAKSIREHFECYKEHYWDAFFGSFEHGNKPEILTDKVLIKKCVAKGVYRQTSGKRSEKKMPTGKICGFRVWDKVKFNNVIYFVRGRMSTGYANLCNIHGEQFKILPMPKFTQLTRISARKSWIMST